MNCEIFIKPRQSGKTTLIIEEFLSNPGQNYILTYQERQRENIIKKIYQLDRNFPKYLEHRVINMSKPQRGYIINKALIDEYLFWPKQSIENLNFCLGSLIAIDATIKVFTTSNRLYHRKIFELVKQNKENAKSCYDLANSLTPDLREEVLELYNSLITFPGAKIFSVDSNIDSYKESIYFINSPADYLDKLKTHGPRDLSIIYTMSEDILEEFIEEIYWPFYLNSNTLSEEFKNKFGSVLETIIFNSRYTKENGYYGNVKTRFETEVIGKLFLY